MPKVTLTFSDHWFALAVKTLSVMNTLRARQNQPIITMESWLKSVVTTGLSQLFAEVENMPVEPQDSKQE